MGGLSIASLYGQHIEDGLNFSCIAFMDGLFFFFFFFFCLFVCFALFLFFSFFLAAHVPGSPL